MRRTGRFVRAVRRARHVRCTPHLTADRFTRLTAPHAARRLTQSQTLFTFHPPLLNSVALTIANSEKANVIA
jgi:hypothetical protein